MLSQGITVNSRLGRHTLCIVKLDTFSQAFCAKTAINKKLIFAALVHFNCHHMMEKIVQLFDNKSSYLDDQNSLETMKFFFKRI